MRDKNKITKTTDPTVVSKGDKTSAQWYQSRQNRGISDEEPTTNDNLDS